MFRAEQVLQAGLAHIAQADIRWEGIADQLLRRAGNESLPTVPGRKEPRDAVDGLPEIVAVLRLRRTGMERHAHAQWIAFPPILREEGTLGGEGGIERGGRGRERRTEGIADRFE